jgi:acyl phosphate:glycerol-3-phosphate acyltransferase
MISLLLTIAVSYLLGSIPFGYVLVRAFRGQDVRASGSGNIGATNVARSSPILGLLTLLLDAAKGALGVYLAVLLSMGAAPAIDEKQLYLRMSLAALFAIIGHIFPVWLKFRGGKGVATAVGSFLLLAPHGVAGAGIIFLLVVLTTGYVSLASVVAAASFPLLGWLFYRGAFSYRLIFILSFASALVILRHHKNISRLFAGTEPRFQLRHG